VLPSVRTAEEKVVSSKPDKEYAGITGVPAFTKAAALLAYGPGSAPIKEDRVAITQSISGTGALRIGGAFLERFYPHGKKIYIPNPSWANHNAVFKDSGLQVEKYRYYNKETIGLDFDGMVADLKAAPNNSIVLLHACAHNPTGIDPTEEQWRKLSDVVKEKEHYPFFDMAYQGFASGDTNKDAFAVRHFIKEGHGIVLAQSFAKNMVSQSSFTVLITLTYPTGPIRRARRSLLSRMLLRRGEEARRFPNQDPRAATLLQPSHPRCARRSGNPQRPRLE
jgi:aspartate aminotransferase, mitochondrial